MKRTVWLWQAFGFAVSALLGTLLHFAYDWLGGAVWIAPFSGVNESTFEHMKLLFWPMLGFALLQSFFFRGVPGFWSVKLFGIALGILLIPLIFYTYNGVVGKSPDFVNIAIFFISAAVAYITESRLFYSKRSFGSPESRAISILLLIALSFVIFTFATPKINLFKDPLTGGYGILE